MKEEKEFYSIGRGSLILNRKLYYGLDYAITDFMRSLEEENKFLQSQLKEKEEVMTKLKQWLEEMLNELKQNDVYDRTSYEMGQIIATECIIAKIEDLEILSKGENK